MMTRGTVTNGWFGLQETGFLEPFCDRDPFCSAQDQCCTSSGSRRGTVASARTAQTPRQIVLAVRLSSEPTPLFRLRFFRRWRGRFLLFRSGSFGLWLFWRGLLRLRCYLLRFRFWLSALRFFFFLRFSLGVVLCVSPLEKRHTRGIALPRAEFEDWGVTAVPFGGSL